MELVPEVFVAVYHNWTKSRDSAAALGDFQADA